MTHPLRKAAQGQPCTLRLPGCDGGGATTVLAHLYVGPKAMAGKGSDLFAVDACFGCHSALDAYRVEDRYKVMLEALERTLQNRLDRGILSVVKENPVERQRLPKILPHRGVEML